MVALQDERARSELVVGDVFLAQHQLDRRLGPLRIGEVVLEQRADQFVARVTGERFHLLVDVCNDAGRTVVIRASMLDSIRERG